MRCITRIYTVIALLLIPVTSAFSGDFATREIIGFSDDGNRFAFEEYGIQDGSGFPYSNIYLIDTQTDNWIGGSPYRARIEDEQASIEDARTLAREMAGNNLSALTVAGTINATNQPLEIVDNPRRMEARPWIFNPPTRDRIEFRIEELDFYTDDYCSELGGSKGFRLTQIPTQVGEQIRLLHEDTAVPQSRGCPQSYRFADIVTYRPDGSNQLVIAVLILFETFGFEGPDGRYLAVTTNMPIN